MIDKSLKYLILDEMASRFSDRVLLLVRNNWRISSNAVQNINAQNKSLNPFIGIYRDLISLDLFRHFFVSSKKRDLSSHFSKLVNK